MPEEDSVFFVKVKDPIELRRVILEDAKDIIESMQRFEKFKEIRKEKLASIERLKADIRELNKLISKLKSALPKANLRVKLHAHEEEDIKQEEKKAAQEEKHKHAKKKHAKAHHIKAEKPAIEKPKSEVEKLEDELGAIEQKIQTLV